MRTTGLIKEINQKKRRETTDIRHFINQTIHSVLRGPSLDLLPIREYLTDRISEDLISFLIWGGVRRGFRAEHRDFHGHISKPNPMQFFSAHRCYRETSGQEQSYPLIQHSNRYFLA